MSLVICNMYVKHVLTEIFGYLRATETRNEHNTDMNIELVSKQLLISTSSSYGATLSFICIK